MLKKMTTEQMDAILETGIEEFSKKGLDGSNINVIAKNAGVSIGVLYKYYKDKDTFFLACLERSLKVLEKVLQDAVDEGEGVLASAERLIRAVIFYSREYSNYINMYHEITSNSSKKFVAYQAKEIEGISARIYTKLLEKAKETGEIRMDMDSRMFAFFFDNLLMMLQFSYCCDYHKERMRIYCGEEIFENDEKMVEQLLKFIKSAFTVS